MNSKKMKLSFFAFFSLVSFWVSAQQDVFRVMASKGTNKLLVSGNQAPLVVGKRLSADDEIHVGQASYVGLVHNATGKTIELKTEGTFKVKDLSSKVAVTNSSFSERYSKYVMDELTSIESSDVAAYHRKNMKVTGSVERAVSNSAITVCLPKTSSVIESKQVLVWRKNAKVKTYQIEVTDLFETVLKILEVTDTTYTLDLAPLADQAGPSKTILVKVKAKEMRDLASQVFAIKLLGEGKDKNLIDESGKIKADFADGSAINYLVKASFFRTNNLFLEAKRNYEYAIQAEPEVAEYKVAYRNFLEKNGLSDFYPFYSSK